MSINATRAQRREIERQNAKMPRELQLIPREVWPNPNGPQRRVFRSRYFLVQEFDAPAPACVRLSVNRTTLNGDRWSDNITWDELQEIKAQCGYQHADAVEVYPPVGDVVNVANMRHIWILRDRLPFAWRSAQQAEPVQPVAARCAQLYGHLPRPPNRACVDASCCGDAVMTDLRAAAQQALEALEWHLARGAWGADIEGATEALRAALEQAGSHGDAK